MDKKTIEYDNIFLDAEECCLYVTKKERVVFKSYVDEMVGRWVPKYKYDPDYRGEIFDMSDDVDVVFYTDLYYDEKMQELIFLCLGQIIDHDSPHLLLDTTIPKIHFCFVGLDEKRDTSGIEIVENNTEYIITKKVEMFSPPTENDDIINADVFIDEENNEVLYVKNHMVIKKIKTTFTNQM